MTTNYIYVLHFCEPLAHARHYVGSTCKLGKRLMSHYRGRGARITQVLHEQQLDWILASLFIVDSQIHSRWEIEKTVKKRKNTGQHCPICHPKTYTQPKGTTEIDTRLIDFPISTKAIRQKESPTNQLINYIPGAKD